MSLKKFHIFFITISGLLSLFLLAWGIWDFRTSREISSLVLSVVGAVGIVALVWYLKWFLKKFSNLQPLLLFVLIPLISISPQSLWACAVCFKDPDHPAVQSAFKGVLFLFIIIASILVAIFFIGRSWVKRAREMNESF